MRIRFLGTGTSTGNPEIGCRCEVCRSSDPRDRRFRSSVLVEQDNNHILIDCGPDFRMQMLEALEVRSFDTLEGVLISHEHYDHVGGLDDLRSFGRHGAVDVYAEGYVADAIRQRIPYVFTEKKYPGVPNINLHSIRNNPFFIRDIEIVPLRLMHGRLPIFGYRINKMAYLTDLKYIPEEEFEKLRDLDVLIINALRPEEHVAHQTVEEAFRMIEKIKPKNAWLIHMSHQFGLHKVMAKKTPANVFISYDGLEITL